MLLPRGDWIETWSGPARAGGAEVVAPAPLQRIPLWVRAGAIVVTYPAEHVARGLGDTPESERPLEATLWGSPDKQTVRPRDWLTAPGSAGASATAGRCSDPRRDVSYRIVEG